MSANKVAIGIAEVCERLTYLVRALVCLSRLEALKLLGAPDTVHKLKAAERACIYADLAFIVQEQAARNYLVKPEHVYWPLCLHPERAGLIVGGRIDHARLMNSVESVEADIFNAATRLAEDVGAHSLAAPVRPLMTHIKVFVPASTSGRLGMEAWSITDGKVDGVYKTATGPLRVTTDPIFTPTYSMLDQPAPVFGGTLETTVPYLWTTCLGETMAAELCALSSVEYEALPLAFHRDMAKQAWDEMRHAVQYLEAAVALLPRLQARLKPSDPIAQHLAAFREGRSGLPVPYELNLYEAILNASLVERLILFQIQTEAPGASRKKRSLKSEVCRLFPDLALALEYDLRDEIVHTRIGKTWLAYLIPDPAGRREAIQTTDLLRSVLLLTSFAHHGNRTLGELMEACLEQAPATSSG